MTVTCSHPKRASGVVHVDLSRKAGNEIYTARLSVMVCSTCGQVELYADAAKDLVDWLDGERRHT
jgi:hypothetical protein